MRLPVLSAIPYSWVVVALCMVATISVVFVDFGFGALYPFIQDDLGLSRAQLGLIPSGLFIGGSVTSLLMGWLADVVGVRRLQSLALLAVALALLGFSQVQSLWQAVLLTVFIGIVGATTLPAYTKALVEWVKPEERGRAIGITEANISTGTIFATLLLTFLAVKFGWRDAVLVLALIVGVASVMFFGLYRDTPLRNRTPEASLVSRSMLASVARNRNVWILGLCGGPFVGVIVVLVSYLVLFLKEEVDMSAGLAGGFLAIATGGGAFGRLIWGVVTDILVGRRVIVFTLVGAMAVLSVAVMIWLPSIGSVPAMGVLVFFVGVTGMAFTGTWSLVVAELAGSDLTGTAIGLGMTVTRVAGFGFAPLFGFVVDRTDSYDVAWGMMAGVAAMGTLFLAGLKREAWRH